jgi:mannose-6-phosphate isomerase-like protein (cupin superfamily)
VSASAGAVVQAASVHAMRAPAGASVRRLIDTGTGAGGLRNGLVRRLIDVPPGARFGANSAVAGEFCFVIDGGGRCEVDGFGSLPLEPDRGVWLPPGSAYLLAAGSKGDLRVDIVSLPVTSPAGAAEPALSGDRPAAEPPQTRDLHDCAVETTGDRRFRVLFGPGYGCSVATQFVGEIPPGRAPAHSHPYDEVVLILRGEGVIHVGGGEHPLAPGTCAHLPPGEPHCLENTGPGLMRVLGVFHPADSPAAKLGHG